MRLNFRKQAKNVSAIAFLLALVGLGLTSVIWQIQAAEKDRAGDINLRTFMRKKLDASSQILEGLTVENSEFIKRGADTLLELSKAEIWQMVIDTDYRQHNAEFRASVRKLANAAEKGNFDNAALQWFDTVKGCIECHQDVRSNRKAKN